MTETKATTYTIRRFLERLKSAQSHVASSLRAFGAEMKERNRLQNEAEFAVFDFCPEAKTTAFWHDDGHVGFSVDYNDYAVWSQWRVTESGLESFEPRTFVCVPQHKHREYMEEAQ